MFASVAEQFLAAPFEKNGWDKALKNLAFQSRSTRMQMLAVGSDGLVPFNWTTDAPEGFTEKFIEIGGSDPSQNWRVAQAGEPFEIFSEHHYDETRARLKCGVYDDYVSDFDVQFGCQTVLSRETDHFIGLAALRTRSDGRTTEADRQVFASAAPQVMASVRMQRAIEHRGSELAAGALEAIGAAAFVLDAYGNVRALTRAGEAGVGEGGPLQLRKGKLRCPSEADNRSLQRAIALILSGRGGVGPQSFWLTTGRGPRLCEIFTLPRREWSLGFDPRALLVLGSGQSRHTNEAHVLRGLFGFTDAEADIVARLRNGESREEIGKARLASVHTVRTQLRTIFDKAGVNREGGLLSKIGRLLG